MGILLFMMCPALAICYIITQAYSGKYKSLTALSLSIAMVALFTPPFADIYRHTLMYFEFQNYGNAIIQSNGHDFIFYTLTNICAQNNIPFEYISFLFVFVCYQVSFYLFKQILKNTIITQHDRQKTFYIFLCFLFMVPFIAIINGLRMATAAYIALLAWNFAYRKKFLKSSLIFIIALCTHFGSWIFLPIIIYTFISKIKIHKTTFIIVALCLMVAGGILLQLLPSSFIEAIQMEDKVTGYMVNNEERFDDTMSSNGRIAMYLERLPLIFVAVMALINRLRLNDRDLSIIYMAIWLSLLYHPFIVLFQRYAFLAVPLLIFLCVQDQSSRSQSTKTIKILVASCMIMTMAYMYGYRTTFLNTKYHKMFYPSLITIPTTDTHELFKDALIPK